MCVRQRESPFGVALLICVYDMFLAKIKRRVLAYVVPLCQTTKDMKEFFSKIWKWIGDDGFKHFCVSALIVCGLGWIQPIWTPLCLACIIGIVKELIDMERKGWGVWKDSLHDLACDATGALLGVLFVWLNSLAM